MTAQEVHVWTVATKMIEEGLRPPIVHAATGLCRQRLRALYRAIHGRPAAQGRLSEYAYHRLKTKDQVIKAIAFYHAYRRLGGDEIFRTLNSELFIDAYRTYKVLTPNGLDVTSAWYLARDLREGFLEPKRCPRCHRTYLYDHRAAYLWRCPLCAD